MTALVVNWEKHIAPPGNGWAIRREAGVGKTPGSDRAERRSVRWARRILAGGVIAVLLAGSAVLEAAAQQPAVDTDVHGALQKGAAAMTKGNFAEAVAEYRMVTHSMPQFAGGYLNLGLALEQAGELDEAGIALKKSLELEPGLRGANLFLGIIDYRENRYADAEARLARETRTDPHDAKAFMWLGVCYLAQGNPQAALPPLNRAYALDPTDADILYHRGHAYLLMADASYAAMFRLNQDSMRVHQVLAESYAKSYRTQQAITEFELTVKMAPHQPGLHEELADQYWVAGDLDKAAEAYREELRIDPYSVTSMYKLGSLLVLNMKAAEGVKLLRGALREDPSLTDAHYYLATGLMSLNENQQAIQEFRRAIAADPANKRAMSSYYKMALLYRKLGNEPAAADAMQNFVRMRSDKDAQQDLHTAQIVHDRASLPVEDPEKAGMGTVQ
ncbi:MAG: tetratricopeptide repeat protein [Terracidiphilus sp.]